MKVWHWLGRVATQQSKDGSNRHDKALSSLTNKQWQFLVRQSANSIEFILQEWYNIILTNKVHVIGSELTR